MSTIDYNPLINLPAGRVLTRPQYESLRAEAINLGRALTASEIEDIVGAPLETPSLKRDFDTGQYPAQRGPGRDFE